MPSKSYPQKIFLCFQRTNFLENLLIMSWHISTLLGLSLIGKGRYTKGKDNTLQFNMLAYLSATSPPTPKVPNQLLKKLTFNLKANSNILNIILIVKAFLALTSTKKIVSLAYCNMLITQSLCPRLISPK